MNSITNPFSRDFSPAPSVAAEAVATTSSPPAQGSVEAGLLSLKAYILLHGVAYPQLRNFAEVFAKVVDRNIADPEFDSLFVKPTEEVLLKGSELRAYLASKLDVRALPQMPDGKPAVPNLAAAFDLPATASLFGVPS